MAEAEDSSSPLLIDLQQNFEAKEKATRLRKEVDAAIKDIESSLLYANVSRQLKNCVELRHNIVRVLGSNSARLQMVIYALGSLEFNGDAMYQLAIALLLKRDFYYWIDNIQVFDPRFTTTDIIVLSELGCQVLFVNERCLRKAERPTLFFTPFIRKMLLGNLLGSNWCPTLINQMIILSYPLSDSLVASNDQEDYNSFKSQLEQHFKFTSQDVNIKDIHETCRYSMDLKRDAKGYAKAIGPFTKEFLIKQLPQGDKHYDVLYSHAWHFFKVDPQVDMRTLLRGKIPKAVISEYFKSHEPIPYNFSEFNLEMESVEDEDGCALIFRELVKKRKGTIVDNN